MEFDLIPNFVQENVDEKFVSFRDSIIEGATRMRPSLLSGLLDAVRTNFSHQQRDVKLFELGKVFSASEKENDLPIERELFAIILTGGEFVGKQSVRITRIGFLRCQRRTRNRGRIVKFNRSRFSSQNSQTSSSGSIGGNQFKGKAVGTIGRLNDEISARL